MARSPLRSHLLAWLSVAVTLGACVCLLPVRAEEKKPAPKPAQPERLDFYGNPLPPGAVARIGCVNLRHGGEACSVTFVDGGKTLVSTGQDSLMRFWDAKTGQPLRTIPVPYCIGPASLSPDAKLLFVGGVWDVANRKRLYKAERLGTIGVDWGVGATAPDGKKYAQSLNQDLFVWDTTTGKRLHHLQGHKYRIVTLAFSPDGQTLASADEFNVDDPRASSPKDPTGSVRLWDMEKGKEIRRLDGHDESVDALAFSWDGKQLAAAGRVSTLVWDLEAAKAAPQRCKAQAGILTFSPDGRRLAGGYGGVFILNLADPDNPQFLPGMLNARRSARCQGVCFSPDGRTIAAALDDGMVRLWDAATCKELVRPLPGHEAPIVGVHLSNDGKRAVTRGEDNVVCVWDRANGKELRRFTFGKELRRLTFGEEMCTETALSPNGKYLATEGQVERPTSKTTLKIWDLETGKEIRSWSTGYDRLVSPTFLRGDKIVAAGEKRLYCWDLTTGATSDLLADENKHIEWFDVSGDGRTLAVAEMQREPRLVVVPNPVRLWDLTTGKRKSVDLDLIAEVKHVRLDALGRRLVTVTDTTHLHSDKIVEGLLAGANPFQLRHMADLVSGEREQIRVWDAESGQVLRKFYPHLLARDFCPLLSPDGKILVCIERGGAIKVYEIATGTEIGHWLPYRYQTQAAQLTPDGKTLATGCGDGSALLWDMLNLPWEEKPNNYQPRYTDTSWGGLDSKDAANGYRAVCALAQSPSEAFALLKEHLKPEPARDSAKIKRLIHDLDSNEFPIREAAQKELRQLNGLAEPELRAAKKAPQSLEVGKQVDMLLNGLEPLRLDPGRLAQIRAIQILEFMGNPEALALLESVAKGEPLAELTKDARAALQRLNRAATDTAAPQSK